MDPKLWNKALDIIKLEVSPVNFKTWFLKTEVLSLDENKITIAVSSAFVKGQLIGRYQELLSRALTEAFGKDMLIDFTIDPSRFEKKAVEETTTQEEVGDYFLSASSIPSSNNLNLNPKYNLENFVVGLTNNLAYAAAQAVAKNPGTSYNPLFIYGPSGVGKTHLMQGIGNELLKKNSSTKIVYASSEKFMNDFVDSIQNKRTGVFRQKYRSVDVLLIDDIQFIAGKDSTQEEFFHTFNDLYSKNCQIVLTSDRPPTEMQRLESRLMSRFQGGLMVDVQLPDFDTRIAIIKAKLQEKGDQLPEDVINLIAESIESNTRELEGKLVQIIQISKLTQTPADINSVRQMLGKAAAPQVVVDHKKILISINQYFSVKTQDLVGPRRQKGLVFPRQIAMYLMYEECNLPMEKIGQILGGRDHTTVLHGIEKIRQSIPENTEVQKAISDLKQQLIA